MAVSGAEIASWLLQMAAAAGVATMAFFVLLPTKFGEKYLSFHFDRKLADLKDIQNHKIEGLKEQLSHLGDRGKRSNEREYEALSEIWGQFVDVFLSTERCVTQFIEHPDFTRLSNDEIDAFLNATDFSEEQKKEFKASLDKNKLYTRTITWKNIAKAHNDIFEMRIALKKGAEFSFLKIYAAFTRKRSSFVPKLRFTSSSDFVIPILHWEVTRLSSFSKVRTPYLNA
jgi:hypothetical protein